jgi:hypothetical protein
MFAHFRQRHVEAAAVLIYFNQFFSYIFLKKLFIGILPAKCEFFYANANANANSNSCHAIIF